ncbi:hypothetical protein D3C77_683750 [compost metagenome]
MEFQVEEHLEAARAQRLDHRRAAASEQLLADLDPAQRGIELLRQRQGGVLRREVERNDDRSLASHDGVLGKIRRALSQKICGRTKAPAACADKPDRT